MSDLLFIKNVVFSVLDVGVTLRNAYSPNTHTMIQLQECVINQDCQQIIVQFAKAHQLFILFDHCDMEDLVTELSNCMISGEHMLVVARNNDGIHISHVEACFEAFSERADIIEIGGELSAECVHLAAQYATSVEALVFHSFDINEGRFDPRLAGALLGHWNDFEKLEWIQFDSFAFSTEMLQEIAPLSNPFELRFPTSELVGPDLPGMLGVLRLLNRNNVKQLPQVRYHEEVLYGKAIENMLNGNGVTSIA